MTNTAGLHQQDNPEDVETWKYVDLVLKRVIVRFRATLFSFERPCSLYEGGLFTLWSTLSTRTLKSA